MLMWICGLLPLGSWQCLPVLPVPPPHSCLSSSCPALPNHTLHLIFLFSFPLPSSYSRFLSSAGQGTLLKSVGLLWRAPVNVTEYKEHGDCKGIVERRYIYNCTPFFLPNFVVSNCLVATTPVRTRERRRSSAKHPPKPNQAALLHNTARIQRVRGNTVHIATWSACTAPRPPKESLVRNETRISLPA
jgi:hypothetical protein